MFTPFWRRLLPRPSARTARRGRSSSPRFRPVLEYLEDRTLLASAIPYSQVVLADGPAAYYRLDETSGTTAVDASGNGNNGTYGGTVTFGQAGAIANDPDTAVLFNGAGQITLPAAPFGAYPTAGSTNSYALTFEAWFKTSGGGIILGQTGTGYVPAVYVDTSGLVRASMFWHNGTGNQIVSARPYNDGRYHYLADVYNNGTETLYIDGVAVGSQTIQEFSYSATYNYFLGNGSDGGWPSAPPTNFTGTLDDAAIYQKALTPTQILTHYYASTDGGIFFGAATTIPSGNTNASWRVVTGDVNNDGKADLAVEDYSGSKVSILLGNGAGGFSLAAGSPFTTGTGPNGIVLGDFNGDGKLDLATANYNVSSVSVFLGNGDGTFTQATGSPISGGLFNGPGDLTATDFNGDGKLDLAVMNDSSNTITLLKGNGDGTFTAFAGSPFASGGNPNNFLGAGDVNNDGRTDLVQPNFGSTSVSVLLNSGTGSISPAAGSPFSAGVGSQPQDVALGDFNGDGKLDLAVTNSASNTISIFLGNGSGSFAATPQSPLATGARPFAVATADLNGDGKLDLVVVNSNSLSLTEYLGNGDGTFTRFADVPLPSNPTSLAFADFNGDGAPDMVVSYHPSSANISIFLNEGGTRTTVTAAPNPGTFGQGVTFTATVAPSVAGAPQVFSGSITFFDGATALGTAAVSAAGQASFTTSALAVGTHSITARYTDTSKFFLPSTSAALAEVVNPATSTTTLVSSANPVSAHQPATFTATVTGNGPVPATGSVTFLVNGVALATVPLSNGTASFSLTRQAATSYQVTAVYSGDGNYLTSTSATLTQVVNFPPPTGLMATGADAGAVAVVNVYDATTRALKYSFTPFGTAFRGGVRVAVGDVNGDGVPDVICTAGPGGGPLVAVIDGSTGALMRIFYAFAGSPGTGTAALPNPFPFTGGLNVAAGDVNGDGCADIVVGADAGGSPEVEVFDGKTGGVLANFMAFGAPTFRGGVRVAAGDVNGDGKADIIVGAGVGGGPLVTVYDGATLNPLINFYAFTNPFFTGGVYLAAGDVNGDGLADIVIGAGAGGGPQVQVYAGATFKLLANFYAMPAGFTGGVRVGTVDSSGIGVGRQNLIAGAGPHGGPEVEVFDGVTLKALLNFYAYPSFFTGGVFVGG